MGGGGAEGGAAAAAALGGERAAASSRGREGRKRGKRAAGWARGSGTESVEAGESPAATSRYLLRGLLEGAAVGAAEEKRAPVALVLAPGGGGLGRLEGGLLRWFSRCRALLAFLWLGGLFSASLSPSGPRSPPPAVCLDPEQRVSWGSSGL